MIAPCALALLAASLPSPAPAQDPPAFRVEGRDGRARALAFAPDGTAEVRLGEGDVRVRRRSDRQAPRERTPRSAELELGGGDPLVGEVRGGHGELVFVELLGEAVLEVPIDDLRAIRFPARLSAETGPLEPAEEGDRLYRRTGGGLDRIDGVVGEFSAEGVVFESVLGLKTFAWEEVAALFVEALDGADREGAAGSAAVVVDLVDGSRLRGALAGFDRRALRLARPGGAELELPLAALAEVVLDDGTVVHLSDLQPVRTDEGSPFDDDLGMVWPHRRDRSVTGQPLRAGGQHYPRGLGVHAPSVLEYELSGAWRELRGAVALDDEVELLPARGSVVFRVLGDGELLWESPLVRGGDPPVPLPPLSLEGVDVLALEVDMATELHLGDRADWLGMMLLK